MQPRTWTWLLAASLAAAGVGASLAAAQTRETRAMLRSAVLQALITDPQVGQYPLDASVTTDGRVVLNGALPTKGDKKRATRVVQHVAGVHHVTNHIAINPSVMPLAGAAAAPARRATEGPLEEGHAAQLAKHLGDELQAEPGLRNVRAAISGGQVVLTGQVGSKQAKHQAAAIARRVAPGRKVKNKIRVRH
jgi:osmotically-inducible protein OsmY